MTRFGWLACRIVGALLVCQAVWAGLPAWARPAELPVYDLDAMRAQLGSRPLEVRAASLPYLEPGAVARRQDIRAAARIVGLSHAMQGDYVQGIRYMQTAYDLAREDSDRRAMAAAKNNLGAMLKSQGRLPEAVSALRESARLAELDVDVTTWVSALGNLANLMGDYGNFQASLDLNLQAQAVLETHGGRAPLPLTYVSRAEMYHFLGRDVEAMESLQLADRALPADNPLPRAAWAAVQALVLRAQGQESAAAAMAQHCIDLVRGAGIDPVQSFDCEYLLASIHIGRGDAAAARLRISTMEALLAGIPEGPGVARLRRQRVLNLNLTELALLENRGADAARYQAVVGDLDQRLSSARERSGVALAAAEFLTEGKDMSIALLEQRNANLALQASQHRWLAWACGVGLVLVVVVASLVAVIGRLRRERQRQQLVQGERTRLARDLHDTLLQGIAAVSLQIQAAARRARQEGSATAEQLGELAGQITQSLEQTRLGIWRLRSAAVDSGDLAGSLQQWIDETQASQTVHYTLDAPDPPPRLAPADAENLLRFVQEAVANALRHGHPSSVDVRLTLRQDQWSLDVADDGNGFDVDAVSVSRGVHWGLPGMRERVQQAGGCLRIDSRPGHGTTLRAEKSPPLPGMRRWGVSRTVSAGGSRLKPGSSAR